MDDIASRLFGSSMQPAAGTAPAAPVDRTAEVMYGANSASPRKTADPHTANEQALAESVYGVSSDAQGNHTSQLEAAGLQAPKHLLRERDVFAGPNDTAEIRRHIGEAIRDITPDVATGLRDEITQEYVYTAAAIGLEPAETLELARAAKTAYANGAPDADVRQSWRSKSESILAGYGSKQGAVLAEAKRLINRDPRVKAMLASTGLGDNPAYVRAALSAAARRLKRT